VKPRDVEIHSQQLIHHLIDVLVNNAGGAARFLGTKGQLIIEMEEEVWQRVIDVNLKGTFICIKAVAPQMMRQMEGHIINVSSGSGLRGAKSFSAYSAAKAGVIGLTKSVARELGDYNIKVNALCPGLTLHDRFVKEGKISQKKMEVSLRENVLHRTGSAQQFADFIVYCRRWKTFQDRP
jgi:3-oxoacyl-[acyl-carrier protein] reductase